MSNFSVLGTPPKTQYHKPRLSYKDYVHFLCSHNPSLITLDKFLSRKYNQNYPCRFAALDFRAGDSFPISRQLVDLNHLRHELGEKGDTTRIFQGSNANNPLEGRILIIEDLTVDIIEYLGSEFDIDPLFFATHLHTMHRTGRHHPTPDEAILPSRLKYRDYINISYHRPVTADQKCTHSDKFIRATSIDRKLVFLQSPAIGLAHHRASIIKIRRDDNFWLAFLFVDPPLTKKYFISGHKGNPQHQVELNLRPYLGRYENFAELPKFSENWQSAKNHAEGGMFDDVVRYWQQSVPSWFDSANPSVQSLAYYPLHIVAAEWVKYTEVMHACIKRFEYQGGQLPTLNKFNNDLQELQSWRRRTIRSQEKCRAIIRRLSTHNSSDRRQCAAMETLVDDFEVIVKNIKIAGRSLENTLPIVTSLVQIIDARQSFAETANIRHLTVLALVFVPLGYVSSLFSMNPSNMPGSAHFWVYFAVAIPVTLVVFLIALIPSFAMRTAISSICNPSTGRGLRG
ncbi:hypothetical protein GQ44DRAFT_774075 [Phaeosphaeriaceae sp. PMI808]|nr:hypothetical protein GQ44DRAFT_774075 [Phaeosphaeriaceae sp. PMI808]